MLRVRKLFRSVTLVGVCLAGTGIAADLLQNNSFDETALPWSVYTASADLASGEWSGGRYILHVNAAGANRWDIQFRHQGLTLEQNHVYTVRFTLTASKATQVYAKIGQAGSPYNEYWNNGWTPFFLNAGEPLSVVQSFTMTDTTEPGVEMGFHLGYGVAGEVPFDISFDDIYLYDPEYVPPVGELLGNNTFNTGASVPWSMYAASADLASGEVLNNEYVLHVNNPGANPWDIQFRHQGLIIEEGHVYTVKFKLRASKATQVYVKIGLAGPPYEEYWNNGWTPFSLIADEDLLVERTFTMEQTTQGGCELAFHLGSGVAGEVPFDVFFDDIYLQDPQYNSPGEPEMPKPDIRVNQTGYFPDGRKRATIVNESEQPVNWRLKNAIGDVCLTGTTTVFGFDSASGDFVHLADFSACTAPAQGYVLSIEKNGEELASHPFDIANDLYLQLKYQALAYFYHNRSGIAIEMPYAGSPEYVRSAGHPVDTMRTWPGMGQEDYVLDVSKGWYDAGDHGKYVVNGGFTVWTMMNQYERALYAHGGNWAAFADGMLNIPENGNNVPDILDEARWQTEFMLSMQVPRGKPYAGMAHHKGHDEQWTGIPTSPAEDPMTRYLAPVSTAATLNLAAVAAQSARLWRHHDKTFAKKCLKAAIKAWNAAIANPLIIAPDITSGGGLYGDSHLDDEFYWAACELFVTTGNNEFKKFIRQSSCFLAMPADLNAEWGGGYCGAFSWDHVEGLGTITLALVPNDLCARYIRTARENIVAAADSFSTFKEHGGYLVPFRLNPDGYPWGSNSFIIDNCIVSALACEFTGEQKYLDDVTEGMDYLMGRNAMDKSYVSGYGERPLRNPHHRFWAQQMNPDFPPVPAGVLSGGPNSGLEDPYAQSAGLPGSPAQKCYIDHIESWSTNEIAINWNSSLAWVAAFIDEKYNHRDGCRR